MEPYPSAGNQPQINHKWMNDLLVFPLRLTAARRALGPHSIQPNQSAPFINSIDELPLKLIGFHCVLFSFVFSFMNQPISLLLVLFSWRSHWRCCAHNPPIKERRERLLSSFKKRAASIKKKWISFCIAACSFFGVSILNQSKATPSTQRSINSKDWFDFTYLLISLCFILIKYFTPYCYNIFLFPSAKQASLNERKIKVLSFVFVSWSGVWLCLRCRPFIHQSKIEDCGQLVIDFLPRQSNSNSPFTPLQLSF